MHRMSNTTRTAKADHTDDIVPLGHTITHRATLLEEIEALGKSIARDADPGTYSAERRSVAAAYVPMLDEMRAIYRDATSASPSDVASALRAFARRHPSIHGNAAQRVADCAETR